MDTELLQFQEALQAEVVRIMLARQIPCRLLLGRHDYEVFERLKRLYPEYPNPIIINGREHRFGMEIIRTDADRQLEIQAHVN